MLKNGKELWRTDGTEAGTVRLINSTYSASGRSIANLVIFNNELLFSNQDSLYKTDGTIDGTTVFKDSFPGDILDIKHFNDKMILEINDPDRTFSSAPVILWISDGTLAGTRELKAWNDQGKSLKAENVNVSGDNFYFTSCDEKLP